MSLPPQTIISLPVHTAVWSVARGRARCRGHRRPTVRRRIVAPAGVHGDEPPQTIISLPVHTAVWSLRADGAPVVAHCRPTCCSPDCSARRCSDLPWLRPAPDDHLAARPHRRVEAARARARRWCSPPSNCCPPGCSGAVTEVVALADDAAGASHRPRRSSRCPSPVHTAVWSMRAAGAPAGLIAVQVLVPGL